MAHVLVYTYNKKNSFQTHKDGKHLFDTTKRFAKLYEQNIILAEESDLYIGPGISAKVEKLRCKTLKGKLFQTKYGQSAVSISTKNNSKCLGGDQDIVASVSKHIFLIVYLQYCFTYEIYTNTILYTM